MAEQGSSTGRQVRRSPSKRSDIAKVASEIFRGGLLDQPVVDFRTFVTSIS